MVRYELLLVSRKFQHPRQFELVMSGRISGEQLAALLQRLAPRLVLAPAMVPLMLVVLLTVTASQAPRALGAGAALAAVVPIYVAFLALMMAAGLLLARLAHLDAASARAVTFSGATRNSLVVLPLALATPSPLAPAAVVAQTLVELVGMVVLVRVLPRLLPLPDITDR